MSYKIDPHVHTAEVSRCGVLTAAEVVHLAKDAGYDAIIITDHYQMVTFAEMGDIPWDEKIDEFLKGYSIAAKEGERIGMTVLLGMELRITAGYEDYLVYGIDRDFLIANPDLWDYSLFEFKELIKEHSGILLFQAHPFRPRLKSGDPKVLDGVEAFNGNERHDSRNSKAQKFAKKNKLIMISGSDTHLIEDVGNGGVIMDFPINTIDDWVKALMESTSFEIDEPFIKII